MSSSAPTPLLARHLELARQVCERALLGADLAAVAGTAADSLPAGLDAEAAQAVVLRVKAERGLPATDIRVERRALITAALRALPRIPAIAVAEGVKRLYCQEFGWFAAPRQQDPPRLRAGQYQFLAAWRLTQLSRFPAGQLHWELSGLPRSWLWHLRPRDLARTLLCVAKMGGSRPTIEAHTNRGRNYPYMLFEEEERKSQYLMAESLKLQPEVRGLVGRSWMFSPETFEMYPHLAWVPRPILDYGGLIVPMIKVQPDPGILENNAERARLVREGKFRPRVSLAVWPRAGILAWARAHPEFASD